VIGYLATKIWVHGSSTGWRNWSVKPTAVSSSLTPCAIK